METIKRHYSISSLIIIILSLFFVITTLSGTQESPTSDEPGHIASGIMYLKNGDLTYNSGSPLLSNVISATLPSLILRDSDIPSDPVFVKKGYLHSFASSLLVSNSKNIDLIMFLSRLPSAILGVGVGILIYLWSKKLYGKIPAIIGLAIFAMDPNFLAHSHYATPDVALAFFFLLTLYSFYNYLETNKIRDLYIVFFSFTASQLTKNSAVYLFPLLILIAISSKKINTQNLKKTIKIFLGLVAFCWFSINAFYGFRGLGHPLEWYLKNDQAFLNSPYSISRVEAMLPQNNPVLGKISQYIYKEMPLPLSYNYLKTIGWVIFRSQNGQPAYLFGNYSIHGWWYYYPVLLFFKNTPLFIASLLIALWSILKKKTKISSQELLFLLIPSMGILAVTMKSGIDTGVRQILFLMPLLIIFSTKIYHDLQKLFPKALLVIVLSVQAIFIFSIFPDFTSYYNIFAGIQSPDNMIASDSNIDWGQDVKKLSLFIKQNNISEIKMNLFGVMNTELYGVKYEQYGPSWIKEKNTSEQCEPLNNSLFAISATQLTGVYLDDKKCFEWLKDKQPITKTGESIYIYDL